MPATSFYVIPQNFGPGIYTVEVTLEERGGKQPINLIKMACKILQSEAVNRTGREHHNGWGPKKARERIQVQPFIRNRVTGTTWSHHEYILLKDLTPAIFEALRAVRGSGEEVPLEDCN